ncbi:hypothetical protein V8E36_003249 [Tilletia maclaganii]
MIQRQRPGRRRQTSSSSLLLLPLLILLLSAPAPSAAFQFAVLSSTSCDTLAYTITLESWEYREATYLRTSLGNPSNPTRYTQVDIDKFFTRSQLASPFVTKWNRPLSSGGTYTLYFGLLDHRARPIKLQGSSSPSALDSVTVSLTIPPCDGSTSSSSARPTSTRTTTRTTTRALSTTSSLSTVAVSTVSETTLASSTTSTRSAPAATPSASSHAPSATGGSSGKNNPNNSSGSNSNNASTTSSGISSGALAGAVIGAIVCTCFLLWLLALCRRRFLRSVRNQSAQRASYLGPAPRPLLTASRQSNRYYHTPSPGASIMPPPQGKVAAFFSFLIGRHRRRRSIIQGIPSTSSTPVMRQMHNYTPQHSLYGPEHPRRSVGTITPILRRPEDGFAPVGTAEQVAARRLSRESAARSGSVNGRHSSLGGHAPGAADGSGSGGRNNSSDVYRFMMGHSASSSTVYTTTGHGPLVPLDTSDPYAYNDSAAVGNLVDTSELPMSQGEDQLHHSAQTQQQFPRPFMLASQGRSSSRSSSRGPTATGSHSNTTRPNSSGSSTSQQPSLSHGGSGTGTTTTTFVNPHKLSRARNNDWAKPYNPASTPGHASPAGRSRSSSVASGHGTPVVGGSRLAGLGVSPAMPGFASLLANSSSSGGSGNGGVQSASANLAGGSPLYSQSSTTARPPAHVSPLTSMMQQQQGGGGGAGGTTGLIPLQLAGAASSHLSGAAFPKDPEPAASVSRARSSSIASAGGASPHAGHATLRGRTSLTGPTPIVPSHGLLGGGGGSYGVGGSSGGGGTGMGMGALDAYNLAAGGNFNTSPLMTARAIAPPAPAAGSLSPGGSRRRWIRVIHSLRR